MPGFVVYYRLTPRGQWLEHWYEPLTFGDFEGYGFMLPDEVAVDYTYAWNSRNTLCVSKLEYEPYEMVPTYGVGEITYMRHLEKERIIKRYVKEHSVKVDELPIYDGCLRRG